MDNRDKFTQLPKRNLRPRSQNLRPTSPDISQLSGSNSTASGDDMEQAATLSHITVPGYQTEASSQPGPAVISRPPTMRQKWSLEQYKEIVFCYYQAIEHPNGKAISNASYDLWMNRNPALALERPYINANKLATLRRYILKRGKLSQLEIEAIQQKVKAPNTACQIENNEPPQPSSNVNESTRQSATNNLPTGSIPINAIDQTSEQQNTILSVAVNTMKSDILKKWEEYQHIPFEQRTSLPKVTEKQISKELRTANQALESLLSTHNVTNITELNSLCYATANVLSSRFLTPPQTTNHTTTATTTATTTTTKSRSERVQQRMNKQIMQWRKEVSWTYEILNNNKTSHKEFLTRKYNCNNILEINELLKQKISAKAQRKRRFEKRALFFKQNATFKSDTKRFYRDLGNGQAKISDPPDKKALEEFWRPIWEQPKLFHGNDKPWFQRFCTKNQNVPTQHLTTFTARDVTNSISKAANWKAPGPDKVPNYWLKKLTALHGKLAEMYNKQLISPSDTPTWLTEGITYMIPKSNDTQQPKNYRPITCLSTMYKLLTSILSDHIYQHLTENNLLPTEQRGCRKNSYGTKDQLLINKTILDDVKRNKKSLAVAWIDYKKAFDSLPHDWIVKCLKAQKVHPTIVEFISISMTKWQTSLILNHEKGSINIPHVTIRSGIFQGDSLSPLLFCTALAPLSLELNNTGLGYCIDRKADETKLNHLLYMDDLKLYGKNKNELNQLLEVVHSFSKDISMSFGLDKCAKAEFHRGKCRQGHNITLDTETIKNLDQHETYKYLGIDEGDGIRHVKMKEKLTSEYLRRIRLVVKSQLNSQNLIHAINSLAIPVITYSFGIINWTKVELKRLDIKTRKLLTSNKSHHPKSSVDRLYIKRSEGGRGLLQIEESYEVAIIGLHTYLQSQPSDSALATVLKIDKVKGTQSIPHLSNHFLQVMEVENLEVPSPNIAPTLQSKIIKSAAKSKCYSNRIQKQKEMPMYGQFQRYTEEQHVDKAHTWSWLKSAKLKPETEAFLLAAQDQCLPTNYHATKIAKTGSNSKCRMCGQTDEHVMHVLSACTVLAPTEYLHRHNRVGTYIHWRLCQHYQIPDIPQKWYLHVPDPVTTGNVATILWDTQIQTDRLIRANKPDIVIKDKNTSECWLIDIAIPSDYNIKNKKLEKLSKYKDLEIEIARMWGMRVKTIPVIVGALGCIQKGTEKFLSEIPAKNLQLHEVQKIALLGSAHILRKILSLNQL